MSDLKKLLPSLLVVFLVIHDRLDLHRLPHVIHMRDNRIGKKHRRLTRMPQQFSRLSQKNNSRKSLFPLMADVKTIVLVREAASYELRAIRTQD